MNIRILILSLILISTSKSITSQTLQVGAGGHRRYSDKIKFEYVSYRPCRYESEKVIEPDNERPNQGGLIYGYFQNTSSDSMELRFYRANGKDESHWRLGGFLAWDRLYDRNIAPGEYGVLEINAISDDFSPGKPFSLTYVDRSWRPNGFIETTLHEDPVQISLIHFHPGLKMVELHLRNTGSNPVEFLNAEIPGVKSGTPEVQGQLLPPWGHSIIRLPTEAPLTVGDLAICKVTVKEQELERSLFAHRRVFEDVFPIGTWGADSDRYQWVRQHHIDTIVQGGNSQDSFYTEAWSQYNFRTMVHTGIVPNVDVLRDLGNHPAVLCWMIHDEPDWSTASNLMVLSEEITRHYNRTKPTFITLCRNVKFFEYAPIADIPCQDHYSVTAPSSSQWPTSYGTRLEETGYYTRDLKYASEPKPIWVWSQALADWDERPLHPVPTANELTSQLLFNLGYGAKGILWFTFRPQLAERFPETREAIKGWGRVMELTREDLLGAEPWTPIAGSMVTSATGIEVFPLVSWDKVFIILANTDYEIHEQSYPWKKKQEVRVTLPVPDWFRPASASLVLPDGVRPLAMDLKDQRVTLSFGDIEVGSFAVLSARPEQPQLYQQLFNKVKEREGN